MFDKIYVNYLVNYSSFLSNVNAMNFLLWKKLRAKIKADTLFFIGNSIFHLNLRLLKEDVNFRLKVAKKLLTRLQVSSVKWSDPGHFLKAQGKFIFSFPCTLFFTYFRHLKITN